MDLKGKTRKPGHPKKLYEENKDLLGAKGAYSNVITHALNKSDFITIVKNSAWTTMYEYLDKAEVLYGVNSEIKFWRKFYKIILDCEDQNNQEFIGYLNEGALVACIGLLSLVDNDSYIKDSAIKLKKLVSSGRTAKDRYVFSMVENIV